MRKDSSLTEQQRSAVLALFAAGHGRDTVARHLGVSQTAVRALYDRWRIHGEEALMAGMTIYGGRTYAPMCAEEDLMSSLQQPHPSSF